VCHIIALVGSGLRVVGSFTLVIGQTAEAGDAAGSIAGFTQFKYRFASRAERDGDYFVGVFLARP
jgi:hypothetical protein